MIFYSTGTYYIVILELVVMGWKQKATNTADPDLRKQIFKDLVVWTM